MNSTFEQLYKIFEMKKAPRFHFYTRLISNNNFQLPLKLTLFTKQSLFLNNKNIKFLSYKY